jgi:hypothetical protein
MTPKNPDTRLLSRAEFHATFTDPMRDTTGNPEPVVDIWPYVRALPSDEINNYSVSHELVEYVYRSGDERHDHVLVPNGRNVYLVVVVDRHRAKVVGHHLLDLGSEYSSITPSNLQ